MLKENPTFSKNFRVKVDAPLSATDVKFLKLVSVIFHEIFIFHQMIVL